MKANIKSVIIKISIAFLAIVALLTYFSGTIENYLLPHVNITYGGEGTLKYSLHTVSVIEPPYTLSDSADPCFRFVCDKALGEYLKKGADVRFKASVQASENEFVYRGGVAKIIGLNETEEGIECTAQVKEMELKTGEKMPSGGESVIVDSEMESRIYPHIVMKSAIQNGSGGAYVYLVTKEDDDKRFISKVPATIVAESDFYAAVEMDNDVLPIVLSCSKEIHDGQRVIVDG